MAAVNVLAVLDDASTYVDSDFIPVREARAAVAELIDAAETAADALEAPLVLKVGERATRLARLRAALARCGVQP